jgi:hypothetical protein
MSEERTQHMIDIHPEIDAFWKRQGYEMGARTTNQVVYAVWKKHSGKIIGLRRDNGLIQYEYEGGLYDETEMLRLIKLSAFA